ncbi:hypothetical protein [Tahibacter sp.]|uniref:hypothetical protein n=1 Tax=Tahibacter sp. TaxID=2056211 RepID=UPI0028C3DEF8|nr:hypothetical protein [Tahibacter sp.]
MNLLPLLVLAFAMLPGMATAEELAGLFPALTRLNLTNEGVTVLYPRERSETATAPAWLKEYEAAGIYASAPLTLRLGTLPAMTLICDSGPSADPSCRLLPDPAKAEQDVFQAAGTQFAFLPEARIVVAGHSNNFYDQRKVYVWKGGRFVEVPQPLRHVGIGGTLKQAVTLRRAPGAGAAALGVTLAAGSRVTVLLNDNSHVDEAGQNPDYLLLTAEGIVGWAHLPGQPDGSTAIDGLYFRGD